MHSAAELAYRRSGTYRRNRWRRVLILIPQAVLHVVAFAAVLGGLICLRALVAPTL